MSPTWPFAAKLAAHHLFTWFFWQTDPTIDAFSLITCPHVNEKTCFSGGFSKCKIHHDWKIEEIGHIMISETGRVPKKLPQQAWFFVHQTRLYGDHFLFF
jgi:hypothetical protein